MPLLHSLICGLHAAPGAVQQAGHRLAISSGRACSAQAMGWLKARHRPAKARHRPASVKTHASCCTDTGQLKLAPG